ncbi:MAG: glycosyltransferase [Crenarchaeota archaeon]|nr:MAG: glycosyltransferase [Thermoproteota archaeon]RDJ33823.1 MAG: glycosyltransferase [Thermoproteota archaeon]RDJ37068.1 MAG: glycosyltransferase [Thermoproteota archaeon]RDJ37397.1 MAG: glycosyltransferase [Thermoproteota archaeon]
MELVIDAINYFLVATMIGVSIAWVTLLRTMYQSFSLTPYLDKFQKIEHKTLKVSVILPARNEEGYIEKCLDSLLMQDYSNFEIIAIDDSSEDDTGKIIQEYAKKDSRVIYVQARPKPEGWMGKNWACCEGYKKSSGDLLLFTDSDTIHSKGVISTATSHLQSLNLDALTAIPRMLCLDFWTKITLPMISTFLHTRFSALRVNDPTKKTGYFFGSFFVIKKKTYEEVGTHEGVKQEIIEDGALGKKVKELGYKMKMVRGEHMIQAIWARDFFTLWNALKRLMIPLYLQNGFIAVGIFVAVVFLLFLPYTLLVYSALFLSYSNSFFVLFVTSLIASILIYVGGISDARELKIGAIHSSLGPVGSLIVILGFASGLINAKSNSAVSWRGRSYSMKDHVQSSISI